MNFVTSTGIQELISDPLLHFLTEEIMVALRSKWFYS